MSERGAFPDLITRRRLLTAATLTAAGALLSSVASAEELVDLSLPGGPSARPITTAFPQKGPMILQRTRPPLLETPFEVFDKGTLTPNDQFYVRWHWAVIPTRIEADKFSLAVRGHVNQPLSLSLQDILEVPRVELAAVFRQFARFVSASRFRWAMGKRRHGQCSLDGGPPQGRARQGRRKAWRSSG
jgi:DMSO/TMAO reductase YedYZ molybdopterin-dependent catalytic subunit